MAKSKRRRRIVLLILAGGLVLAAAGAKRWTRGSRDFGFARLSLEWELVRNAGELEKEAASGSSAVYYFTSYFLNGMLSAFEATGDERLLKRTLGLMDEMASRTRRFEGHEVWGPFAVTPDSPVPRPILHFTFQAAVPFARAAAIIRSEPRLAKKYGKTADRYVQFVDDCVVKYFYEVQLERRIPWLDPDQFPLWNDNASNLALNAAFLCRATGDEQHCGLAKTIGEGFKSKLRPYKGGWIWENQTIPLGSDTDNTPGSVGNQAGVPDISHTNREAFLMLTLQEMGMVFTRDDLDRMARTLTDTIWNGSLEDPSFSNYLNGNDLAYRVYKKPGLNGSIYHGWALMGAVSPKAQRVMLATLEAIMRGRSNPALERNATSYGGKMALAGHILRNFGLAWKPRFAERKAPPARAEGAVSKPAAKG